MTCDKTGHIVPAQRHLFAKYLPEADIHYINVGSQDVRKWTHNVLEALTTKDEYIIFGLDDFLPIDSFVLLQLPDKFDRVELGWSGSRKGDESGKFKMCEKYRVSCQFSAWRVDALKRALEAKRSPWEFEVYGNLPGDVYGIKKPFMYIEESALSKRQEGKVNLCGLRMDDINELLDLRLVKKQDIIYGWRGNENRTRESYGVKYAPYF